MIHEMASKAWQSEQTPSYRTTTGLFLSYDDCDFDASGEQRVLAEVLETYCHYRIEFYKIDSMTKDPDHMLKCLKRRVNRFLAKHGQRGNLIIVHYVGHGSSQKTRDNKTKMSWSG